MSAIHILPAGRNLIDTIATALIRDTGDIENYTIVFPGKRPAHFLLKALAQSLHRSFIPPKLYSIEEFVSNLSVIPGSPALAPIAALDAIALLFETHLDMPQRLGNKYFERLEDFLPLGYKMYGELEELRIEAVGAEQLESTAKSLTAIHEASYLLAMYRDFYAMLADKGLRTRAMLYADAAEQIASASFRKNEKLVLAGFYALSKSEQKIFRHLLSLDQVTAYFQDGPGIERMLAKLGIQHTPAPLPVRTNIHFHSAADSHGQIAGLNTLLSQASVPLDANSVIVLPASSSLFPVLEQTLPLLGEAHVNVSLGFPVTQTPLYSFLMSLMAAIVSRSGELWSAQDYLAFILHPYTKNIRFGQSSETTRMLLHTVEEEYFSLSSNRYFSLTDLEGTADVFGIAEKRISSEGSIVSAVELGKHIRAIHDATLRRFISIRSIRDFADKLIALLEYIASQSTAERHPYFEPFLSKFFEVINELRSSQLAAASFEHPEAYFRFFRQYIAEQSVHFSGTPIEGLQILGMLETRNLSFDRVYLLDANDDVFPGGKGQSVLLHLPLRLALGLPTHHDREQLIRYYFDQLTSHAGEAHIFFSSDAGREPSRFVEQLIWERQRSEAAYSERDRHISAVQLRLRLINEQPVPLTKTREVAEYLRGISFSATALDRYLSCGLKFYYSYVLNLRERSDDAGEMDAPAVGRFVHEVLEEYFSPLLNRPLAAKDINTARMEALAQRLFNARYGENLFGETYFIYRQIQQRLKEFLLQYQLPLVRRSAITITELEQRHEVEAGSFHFKGFIDRVELRDGNIFILDYKTGAAANLNKINFERLDENDRTTWDKAIKSFQLPLYTFLYSRSRGVDPACVSPRYLCLGDRTIGENSEAGISKDEDGEAENQSVIERILFRLIDEIVNPDIVFSPPSKLKDTCPNCAFRSICGTDWVV
jgi:ATP-dependent helicase/nuclease subunit B